MSFSLRSRYSPSHSLARNLGFTFAQDTMGNKDDYVDLGLSCAEVCKALDRGLKGAESEELSKTAVEAIERLKV